MPNRLWKSSLHLGLMMLIGAGWVTGVEPFMRSVRPVSAQETNQGTDQTVTGRLSVDSETLSDDSYYNPHTFEAEAGQSFLIEMVSEEFDTYLILLNAEGNQIAESDDGENGTNAQIAITIPATGEYTILANSYGPGETGAYTITIRPTTIEVVQQFETKTEADRLLLQGILQDRVSQFRDSLASWETALQLYREIGDREGEAASLNNLGSAYNSLGEYQRAIDYYEQSLAISREIGDRPGEAASLGNLGSAYDSLGEYQRAIDYYEQSLAISREIGDRQGEAYSLNNLGVAYNSLGEYQRAIDYYEQSLSVKREIGDRPGEAASLGNLGSAYDSLGEYQRAIDYHEQSLAISREIGDREGEGASLNNLGSAYDSLGEYQRAIDYLEQTLSIAREIGDRQGEAYSLNNLGSAYDSLGEYQRAIDYYEQSLAISREIGDHQGEAYSLNNLGVAYNSLGEYQRAIDYYEQSLSVKREIGDHPGEAASLGNLGSAYNSLGEYQRAIDYHEQSLAISREIGDRQGEANSLGNLGVACFSLGQYETAIDYHEQSLAINREIGDRQGEGASLNNLGVAYDSLGEYQRAIDYLEQTLSIAREIGDRQGEANSLGNLGNAYDSLGEYQRAIDYHEQSLAISREIGDRQGEANSLGNLGVAYDSLGEYQRAIDYHEQSLAISREIGDREGEGASLNNLGSAYDSLGEYQRAIDYYEQSLAISREIGDRQGEAASLNNLGLAHDSLDEYQRAIDYHEQSLAISREIGDRQGEANSLGNLGVAYDSLGEYQRAIDYLEQTLSIAREIGDRIGETASLGSLGNAYYSLGDYQRAIDYLKQTLSIAREIGNRQGEANSLNNLGAAYLSTQQYAEAEDVLLAAVEVLEVLRTSDLPDANKISLFEIQRGSYTLLQQVLIAQAKTDPALEIAERARARALVELLATRVSERTAQAVAIDPLSPTQIQQTAQQQNATLVSYSIINFRGSEPVLYIWVIQPTGTIDFSQVPLTSTDTSLTNPIAQLDGAFYRGTLDATATEVADLRSALGVSRNIGVEWQDNAESANRLRDLHQLLIEPIAHLLPTNPEDRVIFIPQGSLFLVPFAALQDSEGNYLIEQHTILTAPSIQTLALTRSLTNNQSQASINDLNLENTLIVGNPTMPSIWNPETGETEPLDPLSGAGQEAQSIAQFLNADYLTGNAATESQIRQRIESAQLIHLATHGLLEYGDPAASGIRDVPGAIALTPDETNDGFLTSAELYDLNLNANLVVLSACDTGRGDITGDGVIGLSRALISAGVPSIVVSLWSIPDAPTAELMTEFYRQLEQTPDKAQALRQAMLITMQTHPDPRDWAAFTLIGEAE